MTPDLIFRFAAFAAVSSEPQAREDKASIPDQIKTARAAGIQQGGAESAGPFIVDGYSRSGYVNLSDALADIPPLAEAVEAAIQDRYDVLIVDNIERMGDLAPMLSTLLKKYRKQIHSARQSGRIIDPAIYDPNADESGDILIHVEGILQKYRINKLRRGWSIGIPKRIEQGLTPLRIPFGYRWTGSKEPPEIDPPRAALIMQMKELLMNGRSLQAIARHADASGIPPSNGGKHWTATTVRYILSNPYYAGIVGVYRTASIYDPKRKKKRRPLIQPRAKWVTGQGRHQPLWDEATHRTLVSELERRREIHKTYAVRFPLSGLLTCSVCRKKLHRRNHGQHGTRRGRWKVLSCAVGPAHVILPYEEGIDLIARELAIQLKEHQAQPVESRQRDLIHHYEATLDELAKQRKRIQDGYKAGLYTQVEAARELNHIETQIETLETQMEESQRRAQIRAEFTSQHPTLWENLPALIKGDDPAVINRLLNALCEKIVVSPDRTVKITWRL
jgi:hypothetical protein